MFEHLGPTDNLDDREFDDEFDDDLDDDDVAYIPCPACGEEIFDDSEQCPYCGGYITFSTSPWAGRSVAWILLGGLGIVAVIYVLLVS